MQNKSQSLGLQLKSKKSLNEGSDPKVLYIKKGTSFNQNTIEEEFKQDETVNYQNSQNSLETLEEDETLRI